jgi:hypothetical protein
MHARERLVRECFAEQACTSCGHAYAPADVLVLARRSAAWIVLARCGECGHRGIYVVSFPASGTPHARPSASLPPVDLPAEALPDVAAAPSTRAGPARPVTAEDVNDMHAFLAHFDGDFRRLFGS